MTTPIPTHVPDALSRLLQQYRGQPILTGLLTAMVTQVQKLEDATNAAQAASLLVGSPAGAQLDGIGALVGAARGGLSDSTYAAYIRGVIAQNFSDGTAPTVAQAAAALFSAQAVFVSQPVAAGQGTPVTPASAAVSVGVAIGSPGIAPADYAVVQQNLAATLGASIGLYYLTTFNAARAFCFAGPQAWVGGFGDTQNPTTGAPLCTLVYTNPQL